MESAPAPARRLSQARPRAHAGFARSGAFDARPSGRPPRHDRRRHPRGAVRLRNAAAAKPALAKCRSVAIHAGGEPRHAPSSPAPDDASASETVKPCPLRLDRIRWLAAAARPHSTRFAASGWRVEPAPQPARPKLCPRHARSSADRFEAAVDFPLEPAPVAACAADRFGRRTDRSL